MFMARENFNNYQFNFMRQSHSNSLSYSALFFLHINSHLIINGQFSSRMCLESRDKNTRTLS